MEAIKSVEPNACVLIISNQEYVPYQRPPLSKELWFGPSSADFTFKDWQGKRASVFYKSKHAYNVLGVEKLDSTLADGKTDKVHFLQNTNVDRIDTEQKLLFIGDRRVQYSKVLIATGGTPKSLSYVDQLPAEAKKNVKSFRTLNDFKELEAISKSGPKTIAVIGGGFLGSELATALAQKKDNGVSVVQIFPEQGLGN
jgi:apoptosis-inducing factor 1